MKKNQIEFIDWIEKFYPKYYNCDTICRWNDLHKALGGEFEEEEWEQKDVPRDTQKAFEEYSELTDYIVMVAVKEYAKKQREICAEAWKNSFGDKESENAILNAKRPCFKDIEEEKALKEIYKAYCEQGTQEAIDVALKYETDFEYCEYCEADVPCIEKECCFCGTHC